VGTLPLGWFCADAVPIQALRPVCRSYKVSIQEDAGTALDGIISFSVVPLRLLTIVGGLTAVLSIAGILACENNLGYTKRGI
jgi:hypothetical protein